MVEASIVVRLRLSDHDLRIGEVCNVEVLRRAGCLLGQFDGGEIIVNGSDIVIPDARQLLLRVGDVGVVAVVIRLVVLGSDISPARATDRATNRFISAPTPSGSLAGWPAVVSSKAPGSPHPQYTKYIFGITCTLPPKYAMLTGICCPAATPGGQIPVVIQMSTAGGVIPTGGMACGLVGAERNIRSRSRQMPCCSTAVARQKRCDCS